MRLQPPKDLVRGPPPLVARTLTPGTWGDFERFFRKYHGVQAGCWCMFYHRTGPNGPIESLERQERNRIEHRTLVRHGRAHGILVYAGRDAVGWCQFGRKEELPRIEQGRTYKGLLSELPGPSAWRITCFFVDKKCRRQGVAGLALRAALVQIAKQGGGVVEAYPATHGRAVATWFGTLGMFEEEGFTVVHSFGRSNVLVRRMVRGAARGNTAPPGVLGQVVRPVNLMLSSHRRSASSRS